MRRSLLALVLCLVGCDEPVPGVPSWSDLDASPPEAGIRGGGGTTSQSRRDAGQDSGPGSTSDECRATLLVIFDRSGSMAGEWTEGVAKWEAAASGLENALSPIASSLTVGAILFPSGTATEGCAPVSPISSQVPFRDGEVFFTAFDRALSSVGGSTPLDIAFQRADEAMAIRDVDAVVVLTDGQPTCVGPVSAVDYAASWRTEDTVTWVIGLPGIDDPGVLDAVAAAGGTRAHLPVDAPGPLATALDEIARESFSQACP